MKNIFFLRHAKSSWDDFGLKDFDRPLSTRGIQDADLMGNYFKSKKITLEKILSSPSKRTKDTLNHFFTKKVPQIDYIDSIYHAQVEDILDLISGLEAECKSIMVVGHNPSMHLISEYLSGNFIEKYPTCGLCWLTITDNWEEIKQGCGTLKLFIKPSQLR